MFPPVPLYGKPTQFQTRSIGWLFWGNHMGKYPAIDFLRKLVYVETGNLYNAPPEVQKCQAVLNNQTTPPIDVNPCIRPEVHFDSILALDIFSGKIKWSERLSRYDVFNFEYFTPNKPDCPTGPNLDADFGEPPMLLTIFPNGTKRDVAVAVQKSGFAWALDRDTGSVVFVQISGTRQWRRNMGHGCRWETIEFTPTLQMVIDLAPSTQTTTACQCMGGFGCQRGPNSMVHCQPQQ